MKIAQGLRIRLKVRLAVKGGEELEKRIIEYIQGGGVMLPSLEKELEGLSRGDKRSGVIAAENAFGDPAHQVEKVMQRSEFPEGLEVAVDSQFVAKGADNNQDVVILIKKVDGDDVTVQLRHPLADKDIEYDVEVLAVNDPKLSPPPLPADAIGASEADEADEAD